MKRLLAFAGSAALLIAAATAAFGNTPTPAKPASLPAPAVSGSMPASGEPILLGVPMLSADQIMINAEKETRAHLKPYFITYQMHEVFVHHGQREDFDYRVWYRADGKGLMQNTSKDHFGRAETYWGYPFPSSPDNDILLYATPDPQATAPPPVGSPRPQASGASAPPIISVEPVIGDRYYTVKLAGVEQYKARPVYHLQLMALRDERAHPWKDLWIDTQTFDVWKAHANARGSQGPAQGTLDATVEFEQVGDYWLVSAATGDGVVYLGPLPLDSGHYEYTFHDFGFPSSIPEWYFDKKLFYHHH